MKLNRAILGVSSKAPPQNRRAGFTIIELIVVIVVFLIICGAAITNWASFTQHQNMRKDAIMLHNTLLATKANAIRDNVEYYIVHDGSSYQVCWEAGDDISSGCMGKVELRNKIEIESMDDAWKDTITIKPNNISAFDIGKIIIHSGGSRKFSIHKEAVDVNPRIRYSSNNGDSWKEI